MQSNSRLLAVVLHDLRNVLAVIRESSGLANDLSKIMNVADLPKGDRLLRALNNAQNAARKATDITTAMDYMAQSGCPETEGKGCDLARVCNEFCIMVERHAQCHKISLQSRKTDEPVWSDVSAVSALGSLFEVLGVCTSVGGGVDIVLSPTRDTGTGIIVEITGGSNTELVIAALSASPRLCGVEKGWLDFLRLGKASEHRFFLSFAARQE